MLRRLRIAHRLQIGRDYLRVVDTRTQLLKHNLLKRTGHDKTQDWASRLQGAVRALNNTPKEPLMGCDPNNVEKQPILEFERKNQGAIDAEKNQSLAKDRVNKVLDAGAFRP